tara:strand:+ start:2429 stop:3850 length:1422 start_codon:yes stop_codon:yes gene_type:complete
MSKKELNNFIYEDEYLRYESYLKGFSKEKFDEFDAISEKVGLDSKIKDLMNSKIVNETENQAALHPQYRNQYFSSENYDFESGMEFYGSIYYELDKLSDEGSLERINIVSIGIGGSFEGPKLMLEASTSQFDMSALFSNRSVFNFKFLTGPNSNEFYKKVHHLDPKKTFFLVFSKSFETIETLEMLSMALDWSGDTKKFLALTSNADKPREFGISYIHTFDKEIGGRYSIWLESVVKIFGEQEFGSSISPGLALTSFHRGGARADDRLFDKEYLNFIKFLSFGDIWMNNFNKKHTRVILSYYWKLRSFPDYAQQLEMESLGKPANTSSQYKNTGQVVFGGYGPKAEHSYLQLLHQGTQEICADIIACDKDKNDLEYIKAITQTRLLSEGAEGLGENEKINGNVPVNLFIVKEGSLKSNNEAIDFAEYLGYLIATWEHRTFITATMLGINPFDQFGVNAGKKYTLARKFIKDSS